MGDAGCCCTGIVISGGACALIIVGARPMSAVMAGMAGLVGAVAASRTFTSAGLGGGMIGANAVAAYESIRPETGAPQATQTVAPSGTMLWHRPQSTIAG